MQKKALYGLLTEKRKANAHYRHKCPKGVDSSALLESMVLTWKKNRKTFINKSINSL